ncbi:MAG: ImmA/IrrE family metallo-endopeptidase [Phreatobacter sp.]|uniref:ImmA/IrrE family metallo-endopeptidase n=1 Tax=Phreatobacter sp. TaxID=1966341 RepID=UPI001A5C211C|nr:ImmA/IrrE family metallo-endopeptidase [Phreatobacter sp.]MBL8568470.1 ImmA/IrrE family metallo-endopeptidase [Phreatobacter sp.]
MSSDERRKQNALGVATDTVRRLGATQVDKPCLRHVLDRAKAIGLINDWVEVDELCEGDGEWDSATKTIFYRRGVVDGANRGNPYNRFTVWHEIGHAALGHEGRRNRSFSKTLAERFSASVKLDEREADYFAAACLIPSDRIGLNDSIMPNELKRRFGTSNTTAEIRGRELERARNTASGTLRKLPENTIDFLKEAEARGIKLTAKLPSE